MDAQTLAAALRRVSPLPYADMLRQLVGGAAAEVPAGLAGIAEGLASSRTGRGADAGAEAVRRVRERLTPEPATPEGAQAMGDIGEALRAAPGVRLPSGYTVGETLAPWGKQWDEFTARNPGAGAAALATAAVIDPSRLGVLTKGLRGAGRAGKAAPPAEALARPGGAPGAAGEALPPERVMSATYEYVPGANAGHVPQMLAADTAAKRAYGERGHWATPDPADPQMVADALYRAAGVKQQSTREGVGQYLNSLGQIENNPAFLARLLATMRGGKLTPSSRAGAEAVETVRGVVDAQEAAAANLPRTTPRQAGKTSLLLERGTTPTAEELAAITAHLRGMGDKAGVTATNRGALVMDFGMDDLQREQLAGLRGELERAYPGAKARPAAYESVYVPGVSTATEGGQGAATARMLQALADAPPEVSRGISESEEVRRLINEKITRDREAGGARRDIQATRDLLANKDWGRVVDYMRKHGKSAAAAAAAMGLSLEGMAAEVSREKKDSP